MPGSGGRAARKGATRALVVGRPTFPKDEFAVCPIQTALDALGKRWSLPILRKIHEFRIERFNQLLKVLPGISRRVLATNLKDLERAGLVTRVTNARGDGYVRWKTTDKGRDAIPVAMMMTDYAARWYPTVIFGGMQHRHVSELYSSRTLELARKRLAEAPTKVTGRSLVD